MPPATIVGPVPANSALLWNIGITWYATVVAVEPGVRHDRLRHDRELALRADHGLGRAAGPRREQEQQRVGHRDRDVGNRRAGVGRERRRVALGLDVEHAVGGHPEVEAVEQRRGAGSVTISWQSVWRMSRASSAPRRVGLIPTTAAARERRRADPEREVGHVLEQHADVERALAARREQERARCALAATNSR